MGGFDALNLGTASAMAPPTGAPSVPSMPPMSAMPGMPPSGPQAGFGSTLAGLQMQLPGGSGLPPALAAGSAALQAMQLQQYQQVRIRVCGGSYVLVVPHEYWRLKCVGIVAHQGVGVESY
jgi:hypothetical protein